MYLALRAEIFCEGFFPHLRYSVKEEKIMFVEALYCYTLLSPIGEFLSIQSTDGVFSVLKEHKGYEFVSRSLIGYRSCGMAD